MGASVEAASWLAWHRNSALIGPHFHTTKCAKVAIQSACGLESVVIGQRLSSSKTSSGSTAKSILAPCLSCPQIYQKMFQKHLSRNGLSQLLAKPSGLVDLFSALHESHPVLHVQALCVMPCELTGIAATVACLA